MHLRPSIVLSFCRRSFFGLPTLLIGLLLVGNNGYGDTTAKRFYDLPSADAARTLKLFSQQSGLGVIIGADTVKDVTTRAVKGEMTAQAALTAMLAGTGLVVTQDQNTGAFAVRREGTTPKNDARPVRAIPASVSNQTASEKSAFENGSIQGRILNLSSGIYLNNARISVLNSSLETYSNEAGEYRLLNVPAGELTVSVQFVGLETQAVAVNVVSGQTIVQDFNLTPIAASRQGVVNMAAFTVNERLLSAQDSAINEQRNSPNIKNVISFEEFGDLADGIVGEYLRYTPGLSIVSGPQVAETATIRGMPEHGTLIMVNGMEVSSPTADRTSNLMATASGNLARVEVTKVPTPDMPANAVGGTINMIQQSGFNTLRPKLKVNVFTGFNSPNHQPLRFPSLGNRDGTDSRTRIGRIQPGFDLSYLRPINQSLAFSLSLSHNVRLYEFETISSAWDRVRLVLPSAGYQPVMQVITRDLAALSVDWRITKEDSLRVSWQHLMQKNYTRQLQYSMNFAANTSGGEHFSQGASTGVGTVSQAQIWGDREFATPLILAAQYRHNGRWWKYDADVSHSRSHDARKDIENGFLRTVSTSLVNLVLRGDELSNLSRGRAIRLTAQDRQGNSVDPYDTTAYSITTVTSLPNRIASRMTQARLNVARDFLLTVPVTLKIGYSINQQEKDVTSVGKTWTFNPPGGTPARLVGNYDIINENLKNTSFLDGTFRPPYLDHTKAYQLFKQHPDWFVLNEANEHITGVNNSTFVRETISAGYIRGDVKLLGNRLWLVGGVRYERTEDEGAGPKNDIRATYVQDADGNLILGANGLPMRITTDPLQNARLQYHERGQSTSRSYGGFYPSLNASFNVTTDIIARAAYARTIGRPSFSQIIPRVVISDPQAAEVNRTITVSNTGLSPWTADNYDFSLESYQLKGAIASIGLFRKELRNFIGSVRTEATPSQLETFGLGEEYLGYDIITTRNFGEARLSGLELSWRQKLLFLPAWADGLQVYGNMTRLYLGGANADDFTSFARLVGNWGVSYVRKKYLVKMNVSMNKGVRRARQAPSATVPENSYQGIGAQTLVDLSFEYRLSRNVSLYGSIRNLGNSPKRNIYMNPGLPGYAKQLSYSYYGNLFTFGLRGDF